MRALIALIYLALRAWPCAINFHVTTQKQSYIFQIFSLDSEVELILSKQLFGDQKPQECLSRHSAGAHLSFRFRRGGGNNLHF